MFIDLPEAVRAIRAGELVAFPTETVYGLGANALDAAAVAKIFKAKGRPHTSPLIVHVASISAARRLSSDWPPAAEALAREFWPGPLTLIVPKAARVPDLVTAGLPSVGLRRPAHPLARRLLREACVPIAAPSANKFTQLSPSRADHVVESFGAELPILDGGPCAVGIESTVFDAVGLRILRPGMVTRAQIEAVVGTVSLGAADMRESPGLHARHYQPKTRLILGPRPATGKGVYLFIGHPPGFHALRMPDTPAEYAAWLYTLLHDIDSQGFDWIAVQPPPLHPDWDGVRDRLQRAAAG